MIRTHRNTPSPVDRFQVLGDRCSGTNYLHHLMLRNMPELFEATDYHWKHGFVDRRIAARPGLLTLVIYRHPVRWLQAVHRRPWNLSASMAGLPFRQFLQTEWRAAWTEDGAEHPIQGDMIPHTDTPFANARLLRSAKIAWVEQMATQPGQIAFLRYEDLNRAPLACLREIAAAFGLAPVTRLIPVSAYKGDGTRAYRPRRYSPLSEADLTLIADGLDLTQEAHIGYDLDDVPAFDGLPATDRRAILSRLRR